MSLYIYWAYVACILPSGRTVSGSDQWIDGTWTFRTLDCSYRGLFVPSWTVRTMDYSYHHWTIRTVMQDSQKLMFPTKMCLCSVCVKPPWIFLTFSPNGWDFLVQILLSDYTFISTLDYKFLLPCDAMRCTVFASRVRNVQGRYEQSMVRTVQGTNSPTMVRIVQGINSPRYE